MPTKRDAPVWIEYGTYLESSGEKIAQIERNLAPMYEKNGCDDAEFVVAAYGTPARIVRYVVEQLRAGGVKVGFFRPITLWPFPSDALVAATRTSRAIGVSMN